MAKLRIFTVAYVPERLGQKWLQHLRDFDTANPDCHFSVVANIPDAKVAEVLELLRVQPELPFVEVIRTEPEDCN